MPSIFRFTALLLIPSLVHVPGSGRLLAQNSTGLQIRALAETLDHNTVSVEVTDAQGAPVSDAVVTFRLPEDGPACSFADGSRVTVVNTDRSGRALATGIRWTAAGTASIRITATKGTVHAGILVERQMSPEPPKPAAKLAPVPILPSAADPIAPKPAAPIQSPAAAPAPAAVAAVPKPPGQMTLAHPAVTRPNPPTPIAAPQFPSSAAPAIEPPHVSITTVTRKQSGIAQASASSADPSVVITGAGQPSHSGSKKWIILAVIAAGAAGGAAVMLSRGKSTAASTTSTSGVSIGAPTISIGAP